VRLNQDETVAYYARYHEVYLYQIESAMRANRHDAFSTFAFVGTNDDGWDLSPSVTGDGLVLYFESQRSGLGWRIHQSVWEASRRNFVGVDQVPGLRDETLPGSDGGPYTLPSGEALYFHSSRFESGQYIARASRAGTAFTGVEQVAIEFATDPPQALTFPVVSPDELTLYFTAHDLDERTDIWRATRTTTTEPFGKAAPVIELSTEEFNEVPSFVSEDGCRLYFDRDTSHPPGWNPGDHHGLVAHREPDSE
jgi:hypothetical protein